MVMTMLIELHTVSGEYLHNSLQQPAALIRRALQHLIPGQGPLEAGPLGAGPLGAGPLGAGPLGAGPLEGVWCLVHGALPLAHTPCCMALSVAPQCGPRLA